MLGRMQGWGLGILAYREVRRLRRDLQGVTGQLTRIADLLEAQYRLEYGDPVQETRQAHQTATDEAVYGEPNVYVNTQEAQALLEVELRLTRAKGVPPTEEEVLEAYHRDQIRVLEQIAGSPPPAPTRGGFDG